jgi:hypothetical protein
MIDSIGFKELTVSPRLCLRVCLSVRRPRTHRSGQPHARIIPGLYPFTGRFSPAGWFWGRKNDRPCCNKLVKQNLRMVTFREKSAGTGYKLGDFSPTGL